MYNPDTENTEIKKEIEIRGRYLMMACDIEFAMLNIIMFCNPDPYNHTRYGQFKEMKMANKIANVKKDLKDFKPDYYIEFQKELEGLEEFRIVRNDMSHCPGLFPNAPDLSIFRINYIARVDPTDKNNKEEKMDYKDYTADYIKESLDRFGILNNHLSALWFRLEREFSIKQGTVFSVPPSIGTFY